MMPALLSGPEATALLERSINYARSMVRGMSTEELHRATPCRNWNLHLLMLHLNESLTTLRQGITTGLIDFPTPTTSFLGHDEALPPVPGGSPASSPSGHEDALPPVGNGLHASSSGDEEALPPGDPAVGLATVFRYQAGGLLGSCVNGGSGRTGIGDRSLPTAIVAATGALEIAVHGWDVGTARDQRSAIPDRLAGALLDLATLLVPPDNRGPLFAAPVRPPHRAGPADRLVAFLGRTP